TSPSPQSRALPSGSPPRALRAWAGFALVMPRPVCRISARRIFAQAPFESTVAMQRLVQSVACLLLLTGPWMARLNAGDVPSSALLPRVEIAKYPFANSKIFPGTVRDYWIYVPKQYDPARPACVHINQDGVQFNAPAVFDELIYKKVMPVTIGVFVMHGR